jgi:hypothetical protein
VEKLAVMDGVNVGAITWDLTDDAPQAVTDDVRRLSVGRRAEGGAYAAAAGCGTRR